MGGPPDAGAGGVRLQIPARWLFHLVIGPAVGCYIAFAGAAAFVVRKRMVAVTTGGGAGADGVGAGSLPDIGDVPHRVGDPVAGDFAGVTAGAALDRPGLQ